MVFVKKIGPVVIFRSCTIHLIWIKRHLQKLIIPSTLDDFVLTLWRSRLPVHVQHVLAATKKETVNNLILIADGVHDIRPETERIAAVEAEKDGNTNLRWIKKSAPKTGVLASATVKRHLNARQSDRSRNTRMVP